MLWLVRPMGFHLDDRYLRRAALDYGTGANVRRHVIRLSSVRVYGALQVL